MDREDYKICTDINYLFRLKKNKRKWDEENIEPDYGKNVYIYSHFTDTLIKKTINEYLPISRLINYLNLKILYIKK